jgi:hypothetical protein
MRRDEERRGEMRKMKKMRKIRRGMGGGRR